MINLLDGCIKKVTKLLENSMRFYENKKINLFFILIDFLAFILSWYFKFYNGALLAIMFLMFFNIWYSLGNLKDRIIFLLMNFSIFLFLLSRPCISAICGEEWWYFETGAVWMALLSLWVSLFSLNLSFTNGNRIINYIKKCMYRTKLHKASNKKFALNTRMISKICLFLFMLSVAVNFYDELQKLLFMQGKDYASIYSGYNTNLPIYLRYLSTSMPYFLCGYLACLPSKKSSIIPLLLFVFSGVPGFLIGGRSALMVKLMFAFFYYCIRSVGKMDKDIWFGKIEKIAIIVAIPVMVIGLGIYNYSRIDSSISNIKRNIAVDFFYKQGTSFDTLCEGFENREKLQSSPYVISYTFGSIVDYVSHGTVAQKLFNAEDLGNGNSMKMAEKSNSSAHHLSYLVLGGTYLQGHGRGTSYLIDTYMDFGYVGIFLFSFIIGLLIVCIQNVVNQRGWLKRVIFLLMLIDIFMMPRAGATDFITFLFTLQFWLSIILIGSLYLFAKFIMRLKGVQNG